MMTIRTSNFAARAPRMTAQRAGRLLILAGAVAISGCSKVASTLHSVADSLENPRTSPVQGSNGRPATGAVPVPAASIRQGSPDDALRSHFEFQRRSRAIRLNRLLAEVPWEDTTHVREAANLYSGKARDAFDVLSGVRPPPVARVLESQSEEILEVKAETETRAVATVRVKYATELSPTLSRMARERGAELATTGTEYRFVMTKTERGWTIENVLDYRYKMLEGEGEGQGKSWMPTTSMVRSAEPRVAPYPSLSTMYD